jgi:peptide/nickel transport system substrate-binding protein
MRTTHPRLLILLAALALLAAACGGGGDEGGGEGGGDVEEDQEQGEDAAAEEGETLVFGTSTDPVVLDGALVSDGESLRAIDQMFEGLVTLRPGTTEVEPGLATEWEPNDEGTAYTFQLRDDVTFHDGTPFNAEAVCFNFDRWYNFEGSFQNPDATYYWQTVFGGFANNDPQVNPDLGESLYESCAANGDTEVTLNLTKPSASFIPSLALTNFTIASPTALEEYGADEGSVNEDGVFQPSGTYGTEHPTGTGPFRFVEWQVGERLVMERNPDYWGDFEGNIGQLIFQPVSDNAARLQALQSGEISGYDLVEPVDFPTIEGDDSLQLLRRPAFNVAYLGFNQANEALANLNVRQAIAHAINREEIVEAFYSGTGVVATQFMPPEVFGYSEDVPTYDYDPDRARQLLEESGLPQPITLRFAYPTDVTRPYMPDPQANFEAMVSDLEEVGFVIEPQSAPWRPDYLSTVQTGGYDLYLFGWTGDIGDPDNFVGTFFQTPQAQWGFDNPELFAALDEAERETDEDRRTEMYQEINNQIMQFLPGLPYAHTEPALGFQATVEGYQPSPVTLEGFDPVRVAGA